MIRSGMDGNCQSKQYMVVFETIKESQSVMEEITKYLVEMMPKVKDTEM
jgi:hypothetical protein